MNDIEPNRLYSFSEAARMIPSSRGGHVSLSTLHSWHAAGVITGVARKVVKNRMWFVRGSELLRLLAGTEPVAIESPAQRRKSDEWADRVLREHGVTK
jgi:hypothetical protein